MRKSFWVCLIAIAVGGISLLVKAALPEQPWLAPALFYLAIVIALLSTLSLAHDMGLLSRVAAKTRQSRQAHAGAHPADGKTAANAAAMSKYLDLRAQLAQYRCFRSSPRVWPAIPPQRSEEKTRKVRSMSNDLGVAKTQPPDDAPSSAGRLSSPFG